MKLASLLFKALSIATISFQLKQALVAYLKQHEKLITLSRAKKEGAAADLLVGEMRSTYGELVNLADGLKRTDLTGTQQIYQVGVACDATVKPPIFLLLGLSTQHQTFQRGSA